MTIVRRVAFGALLLMGVAVAGLVFMIATSGPGRNATAAELLGIPLPASAREEQLAITHDVFGEYRAYVRFVIDPADLPALLADPAFQPAQQGDAPLVVFSNAAVGRTPLVETVVRGRPDWWQPEAGRMFTLVYRSRPGPGVAYSGPDAAWYIVETSDPARAVVHAYVLEV
jgi:hypothetical protein